MTHYEVLGVARDASTEEIRHAFLMKARQHHPDFHSASGERSKAWAEDRMREINEAWQVLGSDTVRAKYDRSIRLAQAQAQVDAQAPSTDGPRTPSTITPSGPRPSSQPSSDFRPFYERDEDDDDSWRYEPDQGDPDSVPPRALLVAPPVLAVLGVVLLAVSVPTGAAPLTAAGLICLVLSVLLFVGAPVSALFRSQSTEERARRRR